MPDAARAFYAPAGDCGSDVGWGFCPLLRKRRTTPCQGIASAWRLRESMSDKAVSERDPPFAPFADGAGASGAVAQGPPGRRLHPFGNGLAGESLWRLMRDLGHQCFSIHAPDASSPLTLGRPSA